MPIDLHHERMGEPMSQFHQEYLVDEQGNRKAVVLPIETWEQILEALDELDDIRAYDEAKNHPSERIPFEQAVSEITEGTKD
jgi:PHD/YefM family antitoxin component YafN of YafNO toxin-antitoxin module